MTDEDKIITAEAQDGEESVEQVLRPQILDEYIGQESVKDQMNIFIEAAKKRNAVSYTHLRAPRDRTRSRMPSSA